MPDGTPRKLLGDETVNTIAVDGANNKWFGTENGGVTYTNPSGQNTIANFSKQNSPIPSDRIVKIAVDKDTGKVFFATDKGLVAYKGNAVDAKKYDGPLYAYPNPVPPNFDGDIKKSDILNKNNLHNTYMIKGLPPTPISMASLSSIEAI